MNDFMDSYSYISEMWQRIHGNLKNSHIFNWNPSGMTEGLNTRQFPINLHGLGVESKTKIKVLHDYVTLLLKYNELYMPKMSL